MKSLLAPTLRYLADAGYRNHVNTTRDSDTITRRTEHEGLSFLTITLPSFGKDLEKALSLGHVSDDLWTGFSRSGGLPRFLGGFLRKVFCAVSGELLDAPSVDCIAALRQLCYLQKKVRIECSEKRTRNAFLQYIETENQVKSWCDAVLAKDSPELQKEILRFKRTANVLFGSVFSEIEKSIFEGTLLPRHGPGATQDKLVGNQKFTNRTWTERLETYFPFEEYASASHSHYLSEIDNGHVTWLYPENEPPVRVISVPKTLSTPRIIAIEPSWMQYIQQALMREFTVSLPAQTGGVIGFDDQDVNRRLAREGSLTGDLATLDLSEASDRVNIIHVSELLSGHRFLRDAVFSCRSQRADVPGVGITPLAKFASMGSALTFPMEAMVFTTICFLGICDALSLRPTLSTLRKLGQEGRFRVYGDDIIVPTDSAVSVMDLLEAFGLRVNRSKSFWTGKFRESCGGDYYDGTDVTPVYLRSLAPTSRRNALEITSTVSALNQFLAKGADLDGPMCSLLVDQVKRFIPLPLVGPDSHGLGIVLPSGITDCERTHNRYQVPLVRAAFLDAPIPVNHASGYDALLKCLLKGDSPLPDRRHLERSGRPQLVRLKVGWVPSR